MCKSLNVNCLEFVKSVEVVLLCLMFKEEWEIVVNKKNCKNDVVK